MGTQVGVTVGADLHGLKVVIAAGDGDGFIRTILGDTPASVDLPLGVEWSQSNGLRFKGSAAFDVALHPHLQIGPLKIQDVTVRLGAGSDGAPKVSLEVGVGISGELGAFSFLVEGIGVRADLTFEPGNAGPFDVALGFKPPNGLGLEIDAGGFTGGGFLVLDAEKGEYSGGLELTFQGTISIRAIGILNTKGASGFSLIVLVVAEFPPIQLSFGFTLLGVGGLLGLNRAVLVEQLQTGIRDGSLNSILFPVDVVANAPRILADLQRIFPAQDGLFLIGPMAKLGWGTPTLVSLELGLILDLPRPVVVIIGILRVAVPADAIAVLDLQVCFVGSIDFAKGQFQFDATLYNSRVLSFTLTGDMAVRVYWKDNANLLLTVGGFHPAYTPPPMNLGTIARLAIVLFEGNPDVRAESYFAVTSNTVQFGARVELKYGVSIFNVYGFVSLDVLINFNPFHFIAEMAAMLAVRTGSHVLFSVRLQMTLEGPTPWHAHGTGSFDIGFIFTVTFSVSFDVTVGDALSTLLAPVDVIDALVTALTNLANWRPVLPPGSSQPVSAALAAGSVAGDRAASVRNARDRAEGRAAQRRDPALRLVHTEQRQPLSHCRREGQRIAHRDGAVARGIRPGAVLRDDRCRKARPAVVRPLRRRRDRRRGPGAAQRRDAGARRGLRGRLCSRAPADPRPLALSTGVGTLRARRQCRRAVATFAREERPFRAQREGPVSPGSLRRRIDGRSCAARRRPRLRYRDRGGPSAASPRCDASRAHRRAPGHAGCRHPAP